jgi:serine/threonine protein kinase
MTESGFWVGPVADPHRLRLTHLLGSGGEGEVWRARDRAGTEYAVKISVAHGDRDNEWQSRFNALLALDVPGLVRVRDVFAGAERHRFEDVNGPDATHRYVVLDYVDGLTLRQWLDEHPTSSARQRVALLHQVARTVDALHADAGTNGSFTHGDIKPTNIIVRPDGTPVLVDLGLVRPAGEAPTSGRSSAYSSPELRSPGGRPTPQTDAFAFAVTGMETITGALPPLDAEGFLDVAAVRALVRRNPALRLRPVLRRQLMRGLATAPGRRPRRLSAIFTVGRRVLAAGTVAVITLSGGAAVALHDGPTGEVPRATPTPSVAATATTSPSVIVAPPKATGSSDHAKAAASVASPTPTPTPTAIRTMHDDTLLRVLPKHQSAPGSTLVERSSLLALAERPGTYTYNKADGWGHTYWSLSLSSNRELHVVDVTFRKRGIAPPRDGLAVSYDVGQLSPVVSPAQPHTRPPGGTKLEFKSRAIFAWDMAKEAGARETDNDSRTLAVLPTKPGTIYVDSKACSGNYEFWVKVRFSATDQPDVVYESEKGPYRHYATAQQMPFVSALYGNNTFLTKLLDHVSGHPAGCGGKTAAPYPSQDVAVAHLLVKYASEVATKKPDLSRPEVLDLVAAAVAPRYTAAQVSAMCEEAAEEHWLNQCPP